MNLLKIIEAYREMKALTEANLERILEPEPLSKGQIKKCNRRGHEGHAWHVVATVGKVSKVRCGHCSTLFLAAVDKSSGLEIIA